MANHIRQRSILSGFALVLCTGLQSCFTTALWTSDMDLRGKAALTPVALTFDAVTLPAQFAFVDHDDHGGHYEHHGQHGHHRYRSRRRHR